ncbi:MAG: hypothetical protein QW279_12680, partial [Candidatus Jordarchaeaceae archaeon]
GIKRSVGAIISKELQPTITREQKERLFKDIRAGGQINQFLVLIVFVFTIFIALNLNTFTKGIPETNMVMSRWCTIFFGITFALSLSSGVYAGALIGAQLQAQNSLYGLLSSLLATGIGVILVYVGLSLYGVAIGSLIAAFYMFVQLRWRTVRLGFKLRLLRGPIEKSSMPKLLQLNGWITLATIGGMMSLQTSQIILGMTPGLGMSAVNKFSLLITIPALLQLEANRLSTILRPGLTQMYFSEKDSIKADEVSFLLLKMVSLVSAAVFVSVWLLNGSFVTLWVGPEYYAGDLANLLASILFSLLIWRFGFIVLLQMRFKYRRYGLASFGSGIINVVSALVLIREFGLLGVFISAIVAEILVIIPFIVTHVLNQLSGKGSFLSTFMKIHWPPMLYITFWLIAGLNVNYRPESWGQLVISSLFIGLTTFLLFKIWLWGDIREHFYLREFEILKSKLLRKLFGYIRMV